MRKQPFREIEIGRGQELFVCCPVHTVGSIDPHWWHSIANAKRAVRILSESFADRDPENAPYYRDRAKDYTNQLDKLNSWVKKEVAKIPRRYRNLCTAHTAYAYFCRDYGFKAVPVQGLTTEEDPKPRYLADVVDTINRKKVLAVFPEVGANPKVLEAMVRETGVNTGGYLLAGTPDPAQPTYIAMMQHNVNTILQALQSSIP